MHCRLWKFQALRSHREQLANQDHESTQIVDENNLVLLPLRCDRHEHAEARNSFGKTGLSLQVNYMIQVDQSSMSE